MKLSQLADILPCQQSGQDAEFNQVSIDSRTLRSGNLYIAIQGERFDGHDFIEQAKQAGAAAAVTSKNVNTDLPTIVVEDTRQALGQYAAWHRRQFDIPIIALTGSSGKTTVKEMLAAILNHRGNVLATKGNFNNDIGAPLTLLRLTDEHDFAVIELGADRPGEIAYIVELAQPSAAMVLNVGAAHVEGFGDIDGVAKAKSEIYQALADDGIAIINNDSAYAEQWYELVKPRRCISFASDNAADFRAELLDLDENGYASCRLKTPMGTGTVHLSIPGAHNLSNACAAAAASYAIGAELEDIIYGLSHVESVRGRLYIQSGVNGVRLIDDTYNANPASVRVGLDFLAQFSGKRLFIFGDMGELGDNANQYHQEIGEYAQRLAIDGVYTCGQLSAATSSAFGKDGKHFHEQDTLVKHVKPMLEQNVTCLIKGSFSARMKNVLAAFLVSDD